MIVKTDPEQFQSYLTDASNSKGIADAVFIPEDEAEIVELVRKFNKEKTRITISGNGTGLTGGRVPDGGMIVSLERLDKILEINETEKYILVQPGVILKDLQDYVESKNLFYPPDPTERNCFIGATVATNSSGARTFKYGATRNWVISIKVILPTGDTLTINRGDVFATDSLLSFQTDQGSNIKLQIPEIGMPATKNAAGYFLVKDMDLIDLFIGSEGTLGIITEIKLRLIDNPSNILSCVVFFESEEDALNFVDEARTLSFNQSGIINARGLEFFDTNTLAFLKDDYPSIPGKTCAVWFEQEDSNEDLTDAWLNLITKYNADADKAWIAFDKKEQDKFKEFRHAISWKVNDYIARRGLKKVSTDISIPTESFRHFHQWVIELSNKSNLEYVIYGHYGNCHPHLNLLPRNQEEYNYSKELYSEICRKAVQLKGTVSAEHGIGKMKREYLLMMYGEEKIRSMAKIKSVLDPNRILNIGNIFEENYLQ